MKAGSLSFTIVLLMIVSLFPLVVSVRSVSGNTMNPGRHHKTMVAQRETLSHVSSNPADRPAKDVSNGRRVEQRNKPVPNQRAKGVNKGTISPQQASEAATAAAAAAAFFAAAL